MKYIDKIFLLIVIMVFIPLISCEDDDEAFVEQKPSVTLISPINKTNGVDIAPMFEWEASDPNGRPLKYDFLLGLDSTKLFVQAENLKEKNYSLTDYKLLKDNTYYWKVIAKNGIKEEETDTWAFLSIPAPDAPVLLSPETETFVREDIALEWNPVAAGDGEIISYKVLLGKTNPPTEEIALIEDGSTSFPLDVSTLEIGSTYYWKVDATDLINNSSSEIRSFKKLRIGAPDEPLLLSPISGTGAMAGTKLDWTDVTDPESDAVSYDVYLDKLNQPVTLVATVTASEYTPVGLDINSGYYWYVVAKDPANNFTESEIFGFANIGASPGFPAINPFIAQDVLSLDESIVWDAATGATTYDVYIDTVNPPATLVASDITETEYLVKNSEIPSDLTDIKTYYVMVVAKDGSGGETNSFPVEFSPQMTGLYTDVRAQEINDYTWVRVGEQVWMSQNLRTKKLKNGEDLDLLGPVVIPLLATSEELLYDEHPEGLVGFTPDWSNTHGRVYSSRVPRNPLIAPTGWHVINDADIAYIRSYALAFDLMGTWQTGGTDIYGLNCVIAGYRYNDFNAGRPTGFRTGIEKGRVTYWTNGSTDLDVLELYPPGSRFENGYRYYPHNNEHLRMWGIRLVKD